MRSLMTPTIFLSKEAGAILREGRTRQGRSNGRIRNRMTCEKCIPALRQLAQEYLRCSEGAIRNHERLEKIHIVPNEVPLAGSGQDNQQQEGTSEKRTHTLC